MLRTATLLVNDASKSLFSSTDTNNPLLSYAYATEALSYVNVALRMAKEAELEKTTKLKVRDLAIDIEQQERNARERLLQLCPQSGSPSKVAAYAGFYGTGLPKTIPITQTNTTPIQATGAYVGPPIPSGVAQPEMFTYFQ